MTDEWGGSSEAVAALAEAVRDRAERVKPGPTKGLETAAVEITEQT
jgi:hypothetical protein